MAFYELLCMFLMSKIWNHRLKDLFPLKISFHYDFSQQKILVWILCFLSGLFSHTSPSSLTKEVHTPSFENMTGSSTSTELDRNHSLLFWLIAFAFTCTIYLPPVVQSFFVSMLQFVYSFKICILVLRKWIKC